MLTAARITPSSTPPTRLPQAALRFAAKALAPDDVEGVTEQQLWAVLQASTPEGGYSAPARASLRKAWREADKVAPPQPEEQQPEDEGAAEAADENGNAEEAEANDGEVNDGEASGQEAEIASAQPPAVPAAAEAPAAPQAPPPVRVSVESFLSVVGADDALAALLLAEVPIPPPPPPPEEEEEAAAAGDGEAQ